MKKILLALTLAAVAHAATVETVVNNSSCTFTKLRTYTVDNVRFVTTPSTILPGRSSSFSINFNGTQPVLGQDETFASVLYKVSCKQGDYEELWIDYSPTTTYVDDWYLENVEYDKDSSSLNRQVFKDFKVNKSS
jgi:hypothetical protein